MLVIGLGPKAKIFVLKGLGLDASSPWPWPWMLGMTLYLTQAASDKNSLLHWCDGVC